MGHEINSPVKTIYLPVFGNQLNSNEYKEKTGIDLYDVFDVDEEAGEVRLKPYLNVTLYFNDDKGIFYTDYYVKKGEILQGAFIFVDPLTTFFVFSNFNSEGNTLKSLICVSFDYDRDLKAIIMTATEL